MKRPTANMLAYLRIMNRGATVIGSGLGDARLLSMGSLRDRVPFRTMQGLIRRGLIARVPESRIGDTMCWHWCLTEKGLAAAGSQTSPSTKGAH